MVCMLDKGFGHMLGDVGVRAETLMTPDLISVQVHNSW